MACHIMHCFLHTLIHTHRNPDTAVINPDRLCELEISLFTSWLWFTAITSCQDCILHSHSNIVVFKPVYDMVLLYSQPCLRTAIRNT